MRVLAKMALSALALMIGGCSTMSDPLDFDTSMTADIRYTEYGIPHIKSDTFMGAGFGAGFAFAEGNLCLFSDHILTLRGHRSKFLGPDAGYRERFILFNGDKPVNNLESDTYYGYYYTAERIAALQEHASQDVRDLISGFVAGYNKQLERLKASAEGPACRDEPWVMLITEDDLYRRALHLTVLDTSGLFRTSIATARPPVMPEVNAASLEPEFTELGAQLGAVRTTGSNALAFGRDATGTDASIVMGNPHFPWFGPERQYAMHLTIPGKYDVFGSTLLGLPIPLLGWNETLAWSITYSTDKRFAIYELNLVPGSPTTYLVDGEPREMKRIDVNVEVKSGDGVAMRTLPVYETAFGAVFSGGPLKWSDTTAYALMDFSVLNLRMMDQYLEIGKSTNVAEVKAALDHGLGLQFSNLVAGDNKGDVLYSNISVGADYSDTKIDRCLAGDLGRRMLSDMTVLVLAGSSDCMPDVDSRSPYPGVIPAERRPWTIRPDYVVNTNDSHWIVNGKPGSSLSGFNRTIGEERTIRGERTRAVIAAIEMRLAGTDGHPGTHMDVDRLMDWFYEADNRTAFLILDDMIADCRARPNVRLDEGVEIDLSEACDVLASWNRHHDLESQGALLFEVFMQEFPRTMDTDYRPNQSLWRVPFDPSMPLETPRGFSGAESARQALGRAVKKLGDNGLPLSVRYGDAHGGMDADGNFVGLPGGAFLFNNIRPAFLEGAGYVGEINYGNSFMHIVTFDVDGPHAKFVIAYSQATDPESPHFRDQFGPYARKDWIDMPFHDADIERSDGYVSVHIEQ
ncbi:MAG: penicillin acylase family protein [Actinobacteria bacterium]|nr:penicillin acylase family protein [Actinomycetota bacterium]